MRRVLSWIAFGILLLAVTAFCLAPHSHSPGEIVDKLWDFTAFIPLAFFAALMVQGRRSAWAIFAAAMAWGVAIELMQLLLPGHEGHVLNAVADAGGAAVGIMLARSMSLATESVHAIGDLIGAGPARQVVIRREMPDIETASAGYATRFAGRYGEYFLRVQEEAVLAAMPRPRSCTVLDIGGGHGQLARPLARAGRRVTVLASAGHRPQCLRDTSGAVPIRFQVGDLLHLPFPDKSFDIVVSVRLLSHVEDWRQLIAEMCRVARHTVILDFPSLASVNVISLATFPVKRRIEGNTRPYRSFFETELRREFARHAFGKAGAWRQFALPMAVHRLLRGPAWLQESETLMRRVGLTQLVGNPVILRMDRLDGSPTGDLSSVGNTAS